MTDLTSDRLDELAKRIPIAPYWRGALNALIAQARRAEQLEIDLKESGDRCFAWSEDANAWQRRAEAAERERDDADWRADQALASLAKAERERDDLHARYDWLAALYDRNFGKWIADSAALRGIAATIRDRELEATLAEPTDTATAGAAGGAAGGASGGEA